MSNSLELKVEQLQERVEKLENAFEHVLAMANLLYFFVDDERRSRQFYDLEAKIRSALQ